MRLFTLLVVIFSFLSVLPAYAGGYEIGVQVVSLKMLSDTDYIAVLAPSVPKHYPPNYPSIGKCKTFEVRGTYTYLEGQIAPWFTGLFPFIFHTPLSKENHLEALQRLQQFAGTKQYLDFDSVGDGLKIVDQNNPCVVQSRALRLYKDGTVLSYYHVI
jgi:hypothetical protein